jgi:hypothetical protein
MNEKEKVEAYISLYKQQMDRFNNTQNLEWKANFGLWALLAGASYVAAQKPLIVPRFWAVFVLCGIVAVHIGWLSFIHGSQQVDRRLWMLYRRKAAAILQCEKEQEDLLQPSRWERLFREPIWTFFEAMMTGLLCVILYISLF